MTKVLTEIPLKPPFPPKISVVWDNSPTIFTLEHKTRNKHEADGVVTKQRRKHGPRALLLKRGDWYIIYTG